MLITGENELLFWGKDKQEIIITRRNFQDALKLSLPNEGLVCYSVILKGNEKPQIFFQFRDFSYTFEYGENPLYPLEYLFYLAIFSFILAFIWLIQKARDYRTKQRIAIEKQLMELQLKSIKTQLDPHFTLNLIASIGDLFDKKDSKKANYVFNKYSTLLRQSIINSDQFTVSLSEELEFVENYLGLEKFRFDQKFDFEINANGIDGRIKIPKMLVHSFVENAIKHGIKHLEKGGKVDVITRMENKICKVIIKDNGVGRNKSKQFANLSTGKGLSIIDQIIESYNKLKKTNISYLINDLDDGEVPGTIVIISIPLA